jgi:hypothetical protein
MSVVTVAIIAVVSGSLGFLTAALFAGAKALDERDRRGQAEVAGPARHLSAPSRN